MSKLMTEYKTTPRLVALAANQAVTIKAHRGTEVRGLAGELWITQEGDAQDYFVLAGARFCAGRKGDLVVSALGHPGRALVSSCDPGRAGEFARNGVLLDYDQSDTLRRDAERLRAEELARLVRYGACILKRAWHRIMARGQLAGPDCSEVALR